MSKRLTLTRIGLNSVVFFCQRFYKGRERGSVRSGGGGGGGGEEIK